MSSTENATSPTKMYFLFLSVSIVSIDFPANQRPLIDSAYGLFEVTNILFNQLDAFYEK